MSSRRAKRRQIINERIGDKCCVCLRKTNLVTHQINGENHESLLDCSEEEFERLINSGLFVRLCRFHHVLIHQLFKTKFVDVDAVVVLLRTLEYGLKKGESRKGTPLNKKNVGVNVYV